MSDTNTANPQMAELWNGPGARSWITAQAVLDQAFHGFETLLADMAAEAGRTPGRLTRLLGRVLTLTRIARA